MLKCSIRSNFHILKKSTESTKQYEIARTPVIAVMGHVNHGKTSLLDVIRKTHVQESEAGGITQNTRAHQVDYKGYKLTFIDTPGHEAFSEMRSRGAKVTDIVMLVVAADDGVQPQTKESIKFAKLANVPVVVAINKIDVPGKNLDKLKQELSSAGLELEDYGGDVLITEVSAKKELNIEGLLDNLLLAAELSNLKIRTKPEIGLAQGFVLESNLDKNLGPVALILVQAGRVGSKNYLAYEGNADKIRSLLDEQQNQLEFAEEGDPVWITGLDRVLKTGETVIFCENEREAKSIDNKVIEVQTKIVNDSDTEEETAEKNDNDVDLLASLINSAKTEEEIKYLNVILKSSTSGTLEAVKEQLENLDSEKVKIKVILSGVGKINEKDIQAAQAAYGIVIGFQVVPDKNIAEIAEKEKVLVKNYEIIYEMLDELGEVLDSMEEPVHEEVEVARSSVKKVFLLSNGKSVAGCVVEKGNVVKGYKVYVLRDEIRLEQDAKIVVLKKQKNEVKEVKKGEECGIMLEPNFEIKEGDVIVCYKMERV
jgi:translation initiation factor IF-2